MTRFLSVSSGDGSGYGFGFGFGFGYGPGDGCGYGDGDGCGYGDGCGSGYGYGSGSGSGSGYGFGSGYGSGSGYGFGAASGVDSFNGNSVHEIDGVQTLIDHVHGNVAKGSILNSDLTLTPCFIVKQDNQFAHGKTLGEARDALLEKLFADMPEEERLRAFSDFFQAGQSYSNRLFFDWHHRLTGSCEMGRQQFARDHGIDVENGSMTPEEFIQLTENAYGGRTIRKLREYYPATAGREDG